MRCFSCSLCLLGWYTWYLPNRLWSKKKWKGWDCGWNAWMDEGREGVIYIQIELSLQPAPQWRLFIKTTKSSGTWSVWIWNIFHQPNWWWNLRWHRRNWSSICCPVSSTSGLTHQVLFRDVSLETKKFRLLISPFSVFPSSIFMVKWQAFSYLLFAQGDGSFPGKYSVAK